MRPLVLLLCLAATVAAEPLDRLVPDTALLYAAAEDVSGTRARYRESRLRALWNDPAVQLFLEKPRTRWAELVRRVAGPGGVSPAEIFSVVDGALAFAVTGIDEKGVRGLLVAEVDAARARAVLARAEARLGAPRTVEDFRGVTLVRCGDACWFLDGGTFAFATSIEELRRVVRRGGREDAPVLASFEPYRRVRARAGARSDVTLYANCRALGALAGARERRIVEALGLGAVEAVAVRASLEPDGLGTRVFVSMPDGKTGVLRAFDASNTALLPPSFVGDDVAAVSTLAVDLPALWAELRLAGERLRPGFSARVERAVRVAERVAGLDLQEAVDALGGRVTWLRRSGVEEPSLLLAIEVRDDEKLKAAADKLAMFGMMQGILREDAVEGVNVYRVVRGLPVEPSFALLPGQLVVGLDREDVLAVARRLGRRRPSVREAEDFARGLRRVPEGRIFLGFSREAKALRQSLLLSMAPRLRPFVDMSLFPGEEVLARYLDVGAGSIVNAEDGVLITGFVAFR